MSHQSRRDVLVPERDEDAEGEYVPDLIASLGSLDTIMGEVGR